MKRGKRLGLMALVLLAGVAIWFWIATPTDPGAVTASRTAPQSSEAALPGDGQQTVGRKASERSHPDSMEGRRDSPAPLPKQAETRVSLMRDVETAASAVARAEALQRLAESEPVLAARKLLELSAFCDPENIRAQEVRGAAPESIEQRREWCAGLDLSTEAMKSRVEELMNIEGDLDGEAARIERMARDPYIGRRYELEEDLARAGQEDQSDRFTELLRQARGFDDVMFLATLNTQHAQDHGGRPMWQLGVDIQRRHYPQAELMHAQRVAMVLYGCRRFGGCGAGQYTTMIFCTLGAFGQCGPGSSIQEHLYLTTAPATYSLALDILPRI